MSPNFQRSKLGFSCNAHWQFKVHRIHNDPNCVRPIRRGVDPNMCVGIPAACIGEASTPRCEWDCGRRHRGGVDPNMCVGIPAAGAGETTTLCPQCALHYGGGHSCQPVPTHLQAHARSCLGASGVPLIIATTQPWNQRNCNATTHQARHQA